MRNLPLPSRAAAREDLIKAIKTYRYNGEVRGYTATSEDIDAILELYDRYDEGAGLPLDVLKGTALSEHLVDALYDAYDFTQEKRKLWSVRNLIFSGVTLCPICGISPARELDHYLPRSVFKTLSIYARNLVPLCHHCNHVKLAGFGGQNEAEKRLLHAYFDAIPDVDFLKAEVDIRGPSLVVDFAIDGTVAAPLELIGRLTHQFTTLRLNQRYRQEINAYLSSHAVALHTSHRAGSANGVRRFLSLQARYELSAFYRNHWRPTLLHALATHNEFCDGRFKEVLPMPPSILDDLAGAAQP
ncbi:HNH endonuclease signature motif containing protein [Bradyrhizobium sp. UFLA01-814]|uniref:HNH endonuclease n=1 Tax=Bradyrhizobium sp. UFLA01-814 TaxID=3023480 RepID=UPI00398B1B4E